MLPLIINEAHIFPFSFWFNGNVRCGMHYKGELYCRIESFLLLKRPQVYQLGCKLAQQHTTIVLSSSAATCSLWGSLRDPSLKRILLSMQTSSLLDAMIRPPVDALSEHYQPIGHGLNPLPCDEGDF